MSANGAVIDLTDVDAERRYLGRALITPGLLAAHADILEPQTFYREDHRNLYRAIAVVEQRGDYEDDATFSAIAAELRSVLSTEEANRLIDLATGMVADSETLETTDATAKHLGVLALRRKVMHLGHQIDQASLQIGDPERLRSRIRALTDFALGSLEPTPAEIPEQVDGIPFVGMLEAMAMPETPIQWVADGLINAGGLTILVGPYKGGKSTLLRILCGCVATGHPFLGRDTKQGRVGYCGLEERFDDLMRHFRTVFADTDEAMQNLAMVSAGDEWVPGKLDERFEMIEASIDRHSLSLLVIGPIQDLIQFGNTNDYAEVKTKMRGLKKVAERTGCAIVSDHHFNKYGVGRNALLGSVAFGAVADQVLYLPFDKEHSVRAFFTDQRVGVSIDEPLGIEYDREGIGSNLGPPPERLKQAMAQQQVLDQVLGFCAEEWRTTDAIVEAVGMRRVLVMSAIQRGMNEGLLEAKGKGVKNDPRTYLSVSVPASGNVIRFPEPNGMPDHDEGNRNQADANHPDVRQLHRRGRAVGQVRHHRHRQGHRRGRGLRLPGGADRPGLQDAAGGLPRGGVARGHRGDPQGPRARGRLRPGPGDDRGQPGRPQVP